MGFSTALSGLKAASTTLSVTGNNIANSQTAGFKESRAQFGDVYVSSMGSTGKTSVGSGVRVSSVAQQFKQGNIEPTGNALDLAISGEGFFAMGDLVDPIIPDKPLEATSFTRNGAFHLNNSGNVVDDSGRYLLAFKPVGKTVAEGFNVGVKTPLLIQTDQGSPTATTNVTMKLNLNGASKVSTTPFNWATPGVAPYIPDLSTYAHTTSITTYDSLGNAHIASTYFCKTANPNEWDVHTFLDGRAIEPGTQADNTVIPPVVASGATLLDVGVLSTNPVKINFDNFGNLLTGAVDSAGATLPGVVVSTGSLITATKVDFALDTTEINKLLGSVDATGTEVPGISSVAPFSFSVDFAGSTQHSNPFTVNDLKQNGLPVGNLTGVDVDKTGVVFAKYSNGFAKPIGQVAMARFPDNQSLSKVGNTTWLATSDSGAPIYGAGGDNNFGVIRSSSIENSNVDLSEQLVKLIVAQQAYQANSQTITTEKSLVDTILRI